MNKSDLKEYRKILRSLRERLHGDVNNLADAALGGGNGGAGELSSVPVHMADIGSDNFEQDFALSLMESEEEMLEAIDAALGRIDEGVYGKCLDCERRIPKPRLKALPHAPLCIECQRVAEAEG